MRPGAWTGWLAAAAYRLALGASIVAATGCGSSGSGGAEGTGETQEEFVSSVPGSEATIWAVGDGDAGDGPPGGGTHSSGLLITDLIAEGNVDRLLYLGDVYAEGTAKDFETNFEPSYGPLAHLTAPTLGDHESGNREEGYEPYWTEATGTEPPDYYSFEAAGWQILGLNSEVPHSDGSDQIDWLEEQTAAPGTCRLAFWHRPRFNEGTVHKGGSEDVTPFWEVLEGRATVVVNGNEHNMQRFAPKDGITQFISGAGGHYLYPLRSKPSSSLEFGEDRTYGALRLKLSPGKASYAFVSVDGEVLDSGVIPCDPL